MSMHHVRCQRKNCNDYEFVWKSMLVVVVNVCKCKINVSSMNNLLSCLTTNNLPTHTSPSSLPNLHTFKHRTYQMYPVDDDLLHNHQPCVSNHSAYEAFRIASLYLSSRQLFHPSSVLKTKTWNHYHHERLMAYRLHRPNDLESVPALCRVTNWRVE